MKWETKFFVILIAVVLTFTLGGAAVFADDTAGKTDTDSSATEAPKNGWDAAHTHYYKNGTMLKGLQTIDGVKYYFNKSDGKTVAKGWFMDKKMYGIGGGKIAVGFKKIDKANYYFDKKNGIIVVGYKKIGKAYYYFNKKSGKMLTGLQTISGAKYFFNKTNGKGVAKGWFMSKKMYGIGAGKIATGYKKIGKKHYYFKKSNGKLAGKGMINNTYYCKGKGKLATGWLAYKKKAYYFNKKNAKMVKGKKVGHLKIPKSGKLGIAYYRGIRVLNKKGWKLRAAYTYSYKLKYANRWMRLKNSEAYANYGFNNGKGNCYVMAGTFYVMAKLLGYNVHQVKGKVDLPHSWTEIKQNGKIYVYDPNFRNETGRNGYKIRYGQRGTWRYNHKKRMN